MQLAHKLLASISEWKEADIAATHELWFEEDGHNLLRMDQKSARNQAEEADESNEKMWEVDAPDGIIEDPPQAKIS